MNIPSRTNEVQIPNSKNVEHVEDDQVERKQPKWKPIPSQGTRPSPRSGHSAVVGTHAMFVFGGRDGNTFKSDVFAFNFGMYFKTTTRWKSLENSKICERFRWSRGYWEEVANERGVHEIWLLHNASRTKTAEGIGYLNKARIWEDKSEYWREARSGVAKE